MSKNQYRTSKSKLEKTPCPYCNQYDGTIQNLRRHIEDKHPGKPYKRKGESDILESFSKQQKKKKIHLSFLLTFHLVNIVVHLHPMFLLLLNLVFFMILCNLLTVNLMIKLIFLSLRSWKS